MQIITSRTPSGIPIGTAKIPGRVYGSLLFGVARRDEPLSLRGITAVTAEIVIDYLWPLPFVLKWEVDSQDASFQVSGTLEEVTTRLTLIASSVRRLVSVTQDEVDRVSSARGHHNDGVDAFESGNLTARYGLRGLGLQDIESRNDTGITADAVAKWAAEWFVVENAAISLTATVAADFDLELPSAGITPTRITPPVSRVKQPTLEVVLREPMTLSLEMSTRKAQAVWQPVLAELHVALARLADRAYRSLAIGPRPIGESTSIVEFRFFGPPPARGLVPIVEELRKIAMEGVSESSLLLSRDTALERFAESERIVEGLRWMLGASLRGYDFPAPGEDRRAVEDLSSSDIALAVREALPTLLVTVPLHDDVAEQELGKSAAAAGLALERYDPTRSATKAEWRRASKGMIVHKTKKSADEPKTRAIVTRDSLFLRSGSGVRRLDFADLAVVGAEGHFFVSLFDKKGRKLPIEFFDWKKRFRKALLQAVPLELVEKW